MAAHAPEVRERAVGLLKDTSKSYTDLSKETGVPIATLATWAKAEGIKRSTEKTERATIARMKRISNKRSRLSEAFLDAAAEFVVHARDVARGVVEVKEGVFIPGGGEAKNLMTAAAIAIDKCRLELGEHTQLIKTENTGAAEAAKAKLDELGERRQRKSA